MVNAGARHQNRVSTYINSDITKKALPPKRQGHIDEVILGCVGCGFYMYNLKKILVRTGKDFLIIDS